MRVAIAGFSHESNTFASHPTALGDFGVRPADQLVAHYQDTFSEMAGYIAGAREHNFELVPLFSAGATPAGPLTRQAYEELVGRLLAGLKQAEPLDGVLLALHGAMVAEHFPHADAETVHRLRAHFGPSFPIVVTHDYHANVPPSLVEEATALVIYKTNPHIDQRERGLQAAGILARTVRGEVRPLSALVKPELLFNIYHHNTSRPPMQPLMQAAIELEKTPGILACSIAAGYQYADVPHMGPSIVVVADGDQALAQREAARLGELMWARREELKIAVPGPAAAVQMAMANERFPVTLLDFGDNIGGGSAGDSTFLLAELLRQGAEGWVVTIWDPASAQQCNQAGIGAQVALRVGGKTDTLHGPTLSIHGRVCTLHEGRYEERERRHGGGRHFDQGLTAVVAVGGEGRGGLLVLNSQRTAPMSIHQLTCAGIQPQHQQILVAKGAVAPRAAYEPVSARLIEVDTPGATAIHRSPSEYKRARKTLYEWQQH
ncbi:MAG: M81 family metallopeptidase [Candidatus Latescibacteria bacterium]|nr:M81 family metallopeptidase [Candidatus Latescibacterota bacterium]